MADGLDMRITCKAIRNAAIGKGFITYSNLAKAHGAEIDDVFHPLIAQLNELLKICFKNGWPALPVIVVAEGTEELTGKNLRAFCKSARKAGYDVRDDKEFADEQRKLIEWAKNADTECTIEGGGELDDNGSAGGEGGGSGAGGEDGSGGKGDHGGGFDIKITYRMIVAAALECRVIHYRDVADAHGRAMSPVLFGHLDEVLEVSFERKWPALTVTIVPVGAGHLSGEGLAGFCKSAKRAGYEFDDCETFAREQMEAVFDWAQTADTEYEPASDGSSDSKSPIGTKSRHLVTIGLILAVGIAAYYLLLRPSVQKLPEAHTGDLKIGDIKRSEFDAQFDLSAQRDKLSRFNFT